MFVGMLGFLLIALGLLALALQRFYSSIPARELKRLAARGDSMAHALYRPVAYGATMRLLLWILFGAGLIAGYALLSYHMAGWVVYAAMSVSFVIVIWLLSVRLTARSAHLAATLSPVLHKMMQYVHPSFNVVVQTVNRYRSHAPHSGLYEKEDLALLIRQQKEQEDNRIDPNDLALFERAMQVNDRKAADIVLPWSKVIHVSAADKIGPILLSELHKSGQNVFAVYKEKPENVVGTLLLADAVQAKQGGSVQELMQPSVSFVHEDFSLRQVFGAFAASGHAMVVVLNSFEEATGVITLQHAMTQLFGNIEDQDIAYEDRNVVAAWQPRLQPAEVPVVDDPLPQPSSEQTEVVE